MTWRHRFSNWGAVMVVGVLLLVPAGALAYLLTQQAAERSRQESLTVARDQALFVAQLGSELPRLDAKELRDGLSSQQQRRLTQAVARLQLAAPLEALTIIARDGTVYFATQRRLIGRRIPLNHGWRTALAGRTFAQEEGERDVVHRGGVIESYVPLRSGNRVIGALETTLDRGRLEALLAGNRNQLFAFILGAFLLVWLISVPLLARAARHFSPYDVLWRMRVLRSFRRALVGGEIELHYQPQVQLDSNGVCGAEALVRWRRKGKLVPPGEFLPHVESSGLMHQLTYFVLDTAVRQAASWRRDGRQIGISVNLSPVNLTDQFLAHRVAEILDRHHLPGALLTLEVTESAVVAHADEALIRLSELAAMGVNLSIDDFGTGHSSLARLQQFPVNEVKIDRAFVAELPGAQRPFVTAIIQMAYTLGMQCVAEGVEDEVTLRALRDAHCHIAQGFHFSRPIGADEFRTLLARADLAPQACGAAPVENAPA